MGSKTVLVLFALVVALAGCNDESSGGSNDTIAPGDLVDTAAQDESSADTAVEDLVDTRADVFEGVPVPMEEVLGAALQAYCEFAMRCGEGSRDFPVSLFEGDVDACLGFLGNNDVVDISDDLAAVQSGDATYDAAAAGACVQALAEAPCGQNALFPCDGMFTGRLANGSPCQQDAQCAGGWCDLSAGCPGECLELVPVGGSCAQRERCERGSDCDGTVCVAGPAPAALGEDCASSYRPCPQGAYCDYDATRKCVARHSSGEACESESMCAVGLACSAGQCAEVVTEAASPCSSDAVCSLAKGLACMEGLCQPMRQVGEVCFEVSSSGSPVMSVCDLTASLRCEIDQATSTGTCVRLSANGEACSVRDECASHYCDESGQCAEWVPTCSGGA